MTFVPATKYMFTLDLKFEPTRVGSLPDGERIDLRYSGDASIEAAAFEEAWGKPPIDDEGKPPVNELTYEWIGLKAKVLSGTDLASIRPDGVATFNGRMTLRTTDGYLLNAHLSGAVDLFSAFKKGERPTLDQYAQEGALQCPKGQDAKVPIALNIAFEGATSAQIWADKEYRQYTFYRYQRLQRGHFTAAGIGYWKNNQLTSALVHVIEISSPYPKE